MSVDSGLLEPGDLVDGTGVVRGLHCAVRGSEPFAQLVCQILADLLVGELGEGRIELAEDR